MLCDFSESGICNLHNRSSREGGWESYQRCSGRTDIAPPHSALLHLTSPDITSYLKASPTTLQHNFTLSTTRHLYIASSHLNLSYTGTSRHSITTSPHTTISYHLTPYYTASHHIPLTHPHTKDSKGPSPCNTPRAQRSREGTAATAKISSHVLEFFSRFSMQSSRREGIRYAPWSLCFVNSGC